MAKRFYPPKFDYVFKRVFGDQRNIHILAAFLMAVLDLDETDCRQLTIIDPHLKPEFTGDKTSILDVKIRHPSGAITNVEIQVQVDQYLRKRVAFTTAKMIAEQLKRGEEYQRAQRVVSIVICGETLLFEEPGYYIGY
jgi:predicted transposase/invertase (TIGR01784 family)